MSINDTRMRLHHTMHATAPFDEYRYTGPEPWCDFCRTPVAAVAHTAEGNVCLDCYKQWLEFERTLRYHGGLHAYTITSA